MRGTIHVRTAKDGTNRYHAVIRLNGKQTWKTFTRKRDAEDYLDTFSKDVRDGTYREIRPATFAQYTEQWKETHIRPDMKPSTANGYRCILAVHLLPYFGNMAMQGITSGDINRFQTGLLKGGKSVKTVRNIMILLGKIFQDAKSDRYLRHSEMEGVKTPRENKKARKAKSRALNPGEIAKLLENCDAKARPVVLTAVMTGMRRGEIFGLRWKDVNLAENVIHVRQALYRGYGRYSNETPEGAPSYEFIMPKSETSVRDIDMSPALKKELLEHFMAAGRPDEDVLVFQSGAGTPADPDCFIHRHFQPAVKAAGLGHVRFHDLRHTYGSLKIEQGENIVYVQRQMGHSSINITCDTYGHLLKERKPEAAARTDELIFGAM